MVDNTKAYIKGVEDMQAALIQTQEDLKAGRFVIESPEEHIARLELSRCAIRGKTRGKLL